MKSLLSIILLSVTVSVFAAVTEQIHSIVKVTWSDSDEDWVADSRNDYEYDSEGREVLRLGYTWNAEDLKWDQSSKTTTGYYSNDSVAIVTNYYLNDEDWIALSKEEYTYTDTSRTVVHSSFNVLFNGWKPESKLMQSFTTWKASSTTANYYWNDATGSFKLSYRTVNNFNRDRNIVLTHSYTTNEDGILPESKIEYLYNADKLIDSVKTFVYLTADEEWRYSELRYYEHDSTKYIYYQHQYNFATNGLVPNLKVESRYNNNGEVNLVIYSNWNTGSNSWTAFARHDYLFNSVGKGTYYMYSDWNDANANWVYNNGWLRGHDSKGNVSFAKQLNYNAANSNLDTLWKEVMLYDLSVSAKSLAAPRNFNTQFPYYYSTLPKELDSFSWDAANEEFTPSTKIIIHSSAFNPTSSTPVVTDVENTELDLIITPNPTSSFVNISNIEYNDNIVVNFYNLSGSLIKSEPFSAESISISELAQGMYILEVVSGNTTYREKLIVE